MFATTALLTCKDRSWLDWLGAIAADVLTIAWLGMLIWWVA
jgi:hypothetical protein